MGGIVIRVGRPRRSISEKWYRDTARSSLLTPVSSMRSFWGLMRAYWFSDRWKEAWALTLVIALLTALSSKAGVWFAVASGELVNSIAFFHDAANTTPLQSLLLASIFCFPIVFIIVSYRWHLLLKALEIRISFAKAFVLNMVGVLAVARSR